MRSTKLSARWAGCDASRPRCQSTAPPWRPRRGGSYAVPPWPSWAVARATFRSMRATVGMRTSRPCRRRRWSRCGAAAAGDRGGRRGRPGLASAGDELSNRRRGRRGLRGRDGRGGLRSRFGARRGRAVRSDGGGARRGRAVRRSHRAGRRRAAAPQRPTSASAGRARTVHDSDRRSCTGARRGRGDRGQRLSVVYSAARDCAYDDAAEQYSLHAFVHRRASVGRAGRPFALLLWLPWEPALARHPRRAPACGAVSARARDRRERRRSPIGRAAARDPPSVDGDPYPAGALRGRERASQGRPAHLAHPGRLERVGARRELPELARNAHVLRGPGLRRTTSRCFVRLAPSSPWRTST